MIRLIFFKSFQAFAERALYGQRALNAVKKGGWTLVKSRSGGPKAVQVGGGEAGSGAATPAPGGAPAAPAAKTVITPKGEETVAPKPQKAIEGMRDEMAQLHGKPQPKEGGDPAAAAKPEASKRERYVRKDGKIGERWKVGDKWRYGKTAMEPEEGELERLKGAKAPAAKPKAAPKAVPASSAPSEKPKGSIPGLVDDAWHEQQKKKLLESKAKPSKTPEEPAHPKPMVGSAEPQVKPVPAPEAKPATKPGELPAPLKALADAAHDPAALRKAAEGHAHNLEAHDAIAEALQGKHGEAAQLAVESVYGSGKSLSLVPKLEAIGQALKGAGAPAKETPAAKPAEPAKPDEAARQKELADLIASQKADMDADKRKKQSKIKVASKVPSSADARKQKADKLIAERQAAKKQIADAEQDDAKDTQRYLDEGDDDDAPPSREVAKRAQELRQRWQKDDSDDDMFALPKSGPAPKLKVPESKIKTWGFSPEMMAKELSSDDLAELRRQVTSGAYPKEHLGAVDAAIKIKMPKATPMPSAAQDKPKKMTAQEKLRAKNREDFMQSQKDRAARIDESFRKTDERLQEAKAKRESAPVQEPPESPKQNPASVTKQSVGGDAAWALHSWGWRGGKAKEVADTLAKHKDDPQYLQKVFEAMKVSNAKNGAKAMPPEAIAEVAKILKDKYGVSVGQEAKAQAASPSVDSHVADLKSLYDKVYQGSLKSSYEDIESQIAPLSKAQVADLKKLADKIGVYYKPGTSKASLFRKIADHIHERNQFHSVATGNA